MEARSCDGPVPGGATVQSRHARPGPEGWSCTAWSGRPRGHCPGLAAETRPGLVDWCPATSQCQMAHRGGTWWFALGWPALVWVVMLGQGRTLCSLRAGIPRPLRLAGEVTAMEAGAGDTRGCRACGPVAAAHVPCKLSARPPGCTAAWRRVWVPLDLTEAVQVGPRRSLSRSGGAQPPSLCSAVSPAAAL